MLDPDLAKAHALALQRIINELNAMALPSKKSEAWYHSVIMAINWLETASSFLPLRAELEK